MKTFVMLSIFTKMLTAAVAEAQSAQALSPMGDVFTLNLVVGCAPTQSLGEAGGEGLAFLHFTAKPGATYFFETHNCGWAIRHGHQANSATWSSSNRTKVKAKILFPRAGSFSTEKRVRQ